MEIKLKPTEIIKMLEDAGFTNVVFEQYGTEGDYNPYFKMETKMGKEEK